MDFRKPPLLESLTPFSRLLFTILLIISCFVISFFLGFLLAGPLFGVGVYNIISVMSDIENVKSIRLLQYFQVIQSFGLFIIPALLAGYLFERNSLSYLRLDKQPRWAIYIITIALMFISLPFINWLVTWNEGLNLPAFLQGMEDWMKTAEDEAARLTGAFMKMPTFGSFLFNMAMIALLPAIGEEFMFRGLLQRLLKDWLGNIHLAIFISAFLFSAMHFQFFGFFPRMLLGIMFGYLFFWSGSLWVPVCAHFINNVSVVIVSYLAQQQILGSDYEDFGATDNTYLILLSVVATAFLLFFIYRLMRANHPVSA